MPGIVLARYDANNKDWNEVASSERRERIRQIDHYFDYYKGNHHRWLKKAAGQLKDENITINLCGRAVDKLDEFIDVPERFELPGENNNDNPQRTALEGAWDSLKDVAQEASLAGLISGHFFVKLYTDLDNRPQFTALDSRHVTVFWDVTNIRYPLFYRMEWKIGETAYRQDIVPDYMLLDEVTLARPQSWTIIDYRETRSSTWIETARQEWPYAFAPIIEWPLKKLPNSYYGASMLYRSTELNDSINFVVSNTARILKHHAHPKTFVFGVKLAGEDAVGGMWDDLPSDARVETLELQSDLQSSLALVNLLKADFFATQRVLDFSTIKDKLGNLTNFGVRMLFSDMTALTESIRVGNGKGFAEALRRVMEMSGVSMPVPPTAQWADPLPANRLEVLEAAKVEKELGTTSLETLTTEIGRDPELEAQRKADEDTGGMDAMVTAFERVGQRGVFG